MALKAQQRVSSLRRRFTRQRARRHRATTSSRAARARTSRRPGADAYAAQARSRLKRFRQGSTLAVALTAILLLVGGVTDEVTGQEPASQPGVDAAADAGVALEQAGTTVRDLLLGFYAYLPKVALALIVLGIAWVVARVLRMLLRAALGQWERTDAVSAISAIGVYLAAGVVAMSILAGDARALLGSVGLIGLALSWALQTPIESFTGWFLNSLRGYYRVGDRIEVGDVFGDVYRIDVLTTTVWEAGGPGKAVAGAQPTGAMITFPNWEVLRSNVVNYSREFPYVWDEVTVGVANESDLAYTAKVFRDIAHDLLGAEMQGPARSDI
jgi:small-conductance mechanosensitive channel